MIWDHLFGTYQSENSKTHDYGILHDIKTHNVFNIVFDEFRNMMRDVKNAPDLKSKFSYIFKAPGWKHIGKDERVSTLQKNVK